MKKIILLAMAVVLCFSCSKDNTHYGELYIYAVTDAETEFSGRLNLLPGNRATGSYRTSQFVYFNCNGIEDDIEGRHSTEHGVHYSKRIEVGDWSVYLKDGNEYTKIGSVQVRTNEKAWLNVMTLLED